MRKSALGVGIVGCGAITQAAHLPALESLPETFRITHCVDVDRDVAERVAARTPGARAGTELAALLDDPDVDVVAVCVPDRLHADVIIAACAAGKRAVLCEKPLAGTLADADRVVEASDATGTPVLVATMHRYDPAVAALERECPDLLIEANLIRSTMHVPENEIVTRHAVELALPGSPVSTPTPAADPPDPAVVRTILPGAWAVTTFVHHFPLLRMAVGGDPDRIAAHALGLSGAQVSLGWGGRAAQFSGIVHAVPAIDWSFELWGPDAHARVEFPPSFLSGRAAVARVWRTDGSMVSERRLAAPHETGYRSQWRHLAAVAEGRAAPKTSARSARDDVALAAAIGQAGRQASSPLVDGEPR